MVSANAFPVMGGAETHIHEVAPRIAGSGFDVTVLTTDRSAQLAAAERVNGVDVRRVRAWPKGRDYYFAPGLYRELTRQHWDLIHCQGYHTLVPVLAMLAAIRTRTPFVVTFHSGGHGSHLRTRLRSIQRRMLRPLLARARRLIAVSDWERVELAALLRLPGSRFVTIPNGAAMQAAPSTVAEDPSLIVSIGRLERYKGHHRAIAAMPHLLELIPEARLRIVGAGPYEAELRRLTDELGVSDMVEIAGVDPRNRDAMARLLTSSALVLLLSEYESQGIAALEALSLGRRLAVADSTALRDLASKGWARAISLDATSAETAQAIFEHLQSDPPQALDLPTWDSCAAQLASLYRDVLGTRTRGQP